MVDQPAQFSCKECEDEYCEVCFASQHRKGSRKKHTVTPISGSPKRADQAQNGTGTAAEGEGKSDEVFTSTRLLFNFIDPPPQVEADVEMEEDSDAELDQMAARSATGPSVELLGAQPAIGSTVGEWFVERAKYIPLRLTLGERKYLRLLDAALQVSEYTDKIDTLSFGLSKAKRIVHQIRELCAILSGLVLSADYKLGQELFADRDFQCNAEFYQQIFELGRRHKIMNPDKMRTTYGKLIYLLQVRMIFGMLGSND